MLTDFIADFIFATNMDRSGKAASYVRPLAMYGSILTAHYPQPIINGSMWHEFSPVDIPSPQVARSSLMS